MDLRLNQTVVHDGDLRRYLRHGLLKIPYRLLNDYYFLDFESLRSDAEHLSGNEPDREGSTLDSLPDFKVPNTALFRPSGLILLYREPDGNVKGYTMPKKVEPHDLPDSERLSGLVFTFGQQMYKNISSTRDNDEALVLKAPIGRAYPPHVAIIPVYK